MKAVSTIKSKIDNNLAIVIKQMRGMTASLFAISMILAPGGTAMAQAVKWHPGHYMVLVGDGKFNSWYREEVYSELQKTPALRGVVVRYGWAELEKAKGAYDFSNISKLLTELAARKKRLIVLLELKASTPDSDEVIVPNYLKTAAYEGGLYAFSNKNLGSTVGHGIKLWNSLVEDRKANLIRALGKKFNSHPYFEGIGFTETAMGQPVKSISSSTKDTYYKKLLNISKVARANFPNTMTFQYTNFPRDIIGPYVNVFKNTGTALGAPDVFLEDPSLLYKGDPPGVYAYYPKLSGTLPLVVQVEKPNYENTRWDNTGYKPTISQLLNFARDTLDVNYIFWVRTPGYYPKVLEILNYNAQKSTPSGGLRSACPKVYPSCTS